MLKMASFGGQDRVFRRTTIEIPLKYHAIVPICAPKVHTARVPPTVDIQKISIFLLEMPRVTAGPGRSPVKN